MAEQLSENQIDELLDMATYLTMFQTTFMMKAATQPNASLPLWGKKSKEEFAKNSPLPLYYAPSILEELELREFLQLKELEAKKLIRLIQQGVKMECWQLTARGHLVVIWYLRFAMDYQAILDQYPMIDSD
jgi:hypothetical protein